MPVTPFHFGLGLGAKAIAAKRFSFVLFVALQVVIDLESLYNLVRQRYPVHRFLHTFVGATLLAIVCSTVLFFVVPNLWPNRTPRDRRLVAWLLANSIFATWSHVILDGIMHRDMEPLWPFSQRNPLLGVIDLLWLHALCVILGFLGLIGWALRLSLDDPNSVN